MAIVKQLYSKRSLKREGLSNFIALIVVVFFLCIISYMNLAPLEKLAIQSKVNDVGRGAMFRIEADGGLTEETKKLIRDEFDSKGLDSSLVDIYCNNVISPLDGKPISNFGEKVQLKLTYTYRYSVKKIIGFDISEGEMQEEEIVFQNFSTAKN